MGSGAALESRYVLITLKLWGVRIFWFDPSRLLCAAPISHSHKLTVLTALEQLFKERKQSWSMHVALFVCLKCWAGGRGVHFPAAESVAWHSVCSLWPSDVPRSCNLGHSCFPLMFRGWTFIFRRDKFIPFPYQNRKVEIYLELEGKCCLYCCIVLYRSVNISWH